MGIKFSPLKITLGIMLSPEGLTETHSAAPPFPGSQNNAKCLGP